MKNRLFALALAGVTAIGVLATGTSVMAEGDNETTVTLSVPQQEEGYYFVGIPSKLTLDKDGKAVALTSQYFNGVNVHGSNMTKGVKLTAGSDWTLTADGVDTEVGYGLYSSEDAEETTTSWDFTADEINANDGRGTDKAVYGKANADDVKNAKAGEYSDVITFTAEAVKDYTQITKDNVEELVKAYVGEDKAYEYCSEDTAKALASKVLSENGGGEITDFLVVYKIQDGMIYCYGVNTFHPENEPNALEWNYETISKYVVDYASSCFICIPNNNIN